MGDGTTAEKASQLFYISREALKRRQIDELWKARRATSPRSLATILMSDPVVEAVRKELRRSTGHSAKPEDIGVLLRETVIRSESLA